MSRNETLQGGVIVADSSARDKSIEASASERVLWGELDSQGLRMKPLSYTSVLAFVNALCPTRDPSMRKG